MTNEEAIERFKHENEWLELKCVDEGTCKFYSIDIDKNNMAIEALEKDIPVKITDIKRCPACMSYFSNDYMWEDRCKYCDHCGQRLDWSE